MQDWNMLEKKIFKSKLFLTYKNPDIKRVWDENKYFNLKYLIFSIVLFSISISNSIVCSQYLGQKSHLFTSQRKFSTFLCLALTCFSVLTNTIMFLFDYNKIVYLKLLAYFNTITLIEQSKEQLFWGRILITDANLLGLIQSFYSILIIFYSLYFENDFIVFTLSNVIYLPFFYIYFERQPINYIAVLAMCFYNVSYILVIFIIEKRSKEDFFHRMYVFDEVNKRKENLDSLKIGLIRIDNKKIIDCNNFALKKIECYYQTMLPNNEKDENADFQKLNYNNSIKVIEKQCNTQQFLDLIHSFIVEGVNEAHGEGKFSLAIQSKSFDKLLKILTEKPGKLQLYAIKEIEGRDGIFQIFAQYSKEFNVYEFFLKDITLITRLEGFKLQMKYKSMFLSKITHEFKNPLINVIGLLEKVNDRYIPNVKEYDSAPKLINKIRDIKNLCSYMIFLIKDFDYLSISNPETSSFQYYEFRESQVNLEEMVKFCFSIFQTKLEMSNKLIKFVYVIDKALTSIQSDEIRLKQIIINILSNSFKFTQNGEINIKIKEKDKNFIKFSISDTGVGIPKDKLMNIGKPFSKIEGNGNIYGTGLGMNIVIDLINKLGKNFKIDSQPGEGCKISFYIRKLISSDCGTLQNEENSIDKCLFNNEKKNTETLKRRVYKSLSFQKISNSNLSNIRQTGSNFKPNILGHNNTEIQELQQIIQSQANITQEVSLPQDLANKTKSQHDSKQSKMTKRTSDLNYLLLSNKQRSLISREMREKLLYQGDHGLSDLNTLRILVVDDEASVRKATIRIIENYCEQSQIMSEIIECKDGAECILQLHCIFMKGKKIDYIFTDQNMNFIGGVGILNTISNLIFKNVIHKEIKVFMVTSSILPEVEKTLLKHNFLKKVFIKPFKTTHIEEAFHLSN